jgi:hypothetical protein
MQLYSEKIEVECEGEPATPVSFHWREQEFRVEKILRIWYDWGFPPGSPRRKTFRLRRHRTYFQVQTEGERVFELYLDRKGPEFEWVLYREL